LSLARPASVDLARWSSESRSCCIPTCAVQKVRPTKGPSWTHGAYFQVRPLGSSPSLLPACALSGRPTGVVCQCILGYETGIVHGHSQKHPCTLCALVESRGQSRPDVEPLLQATQVGLDLHRSFAQYFAAPRGRLSNEPQHRGKRKQV
jgi:hypothetical protein